MAATSAKVTRLVWVDAQGNLTVCVPDILSSSSKCCRSTKCRSTQNSTCWDPLDTHEIWWDLWPVLGICRRLYTQGLVEVPCFLHLPDSPKRRCNTLCYESNTSIIQTTICNLQKPHKQSWKSVVCSCCGHINRHSRMCMLGHEFERHSHVVNLLNDVIGFCDTSLRTELRLHAVTSKPCANLLFAQ